jgi:hypothetical protein
MSIPIHQSAYVYEVLEKFKMGKAYSTRTPMVILALE